jgi:hypothetical protein
LRRQLPTWLARTLQVPSRAADDADGADANATFLFGQLGTGCLLEAIG